MSKRISFKGKLPVGEQDRIKLSTINGKTGYIIKKFQILPVDIGTVSFELIGQIYKTDQTGSVGTAVDFSNADLLASSVLIGKSSENLQNIVTIFDNEKINQDIFVNITDASGGTNPCNYYIELEAMSLTDLESTMLTLQNIRTITN